MKAVRGVLSSLMLAGILAGCIVVDRDRPYHHYYHHDERPHCWDCRY